MNHCKKCNAPVHDNYCSACGYPTTIKRINGRYIINEIGEVLFVNNGMFHTIKHLVIRPGETVRQYIAEDRSRCVRPISFIVVTSLLYALISYFFPIHLKEGVFYLNPFLDVQIEGLPTASRILSWLADNFAYSNILTGLFMAFSVSLFFRKTGYNLYEIFVLFCFICGVSTLFLSISTIVQNISHWDIMKASSYIALIYLVWATGQFFGMKKVKSYVKAFFSYLLGMLMVGAVVVLIGFLVDFVIHS